MTVGIAILGQSNRTAAQNVSCCWPDTATERTLYSTGKVLLCNCIYSTLTVANNIIYSIHGYAHVTDTKHIIKIIVTRPANQSYPYISRNTCIKCTVVLLWHIYNTVTPDSYIALKCSTVWRETLAGKSLANDYKFSKFKSSKFYF